MDKQLKKLLKNCLKQQNNGNERTVDKGKKKRISWMSVEDKHKSKIPFRSTPFPTKVKTSNKEPKSRTVLSFDDSDLDLNLENNNEETSFTKSHEQKLKKRKLNATDKKFGKQKNAWFETNISSPTPSHDSNDSSDLSSCNIYTSENFDPEGKLASKILAKIHDKDLDSEQSTVCREADQIELLDNFESLNKFAFYDSYSTDGDSVSSSDEPFQIPKLIKNAKRFKRQCRINEPRNVQLPVTDTVEKNYKVEKDLHEKNSTKINQSDEFDTDTNMDETLATTNLDVNSSDDECFKDTLTNMGISIDANKQLQTSIEYFICTNYCLFIINRPIKLHFCGKLSVSVLSGAIEVNGYVLDSKTENAEIYSPKSNGLSLQTVAAPKNVHLLDLLKRYLEEKIIDSKKLTEAYCVLVLKNLENHLLSSLDNYIPQQYFPKIHRTYEERYLSLAEHRLQCYFEVQPTEWVTCRLNLQWDSIVDTLETGRQGKTDSPHCLFACGGKGVGKSTFLRYVVNRLLNNVTKVAWIDLDPGQPEFTISGCISVTVVDAPLLGPNFTHLRTPDRCCFVGEVNIAHCFSQYLNAVEKLMAYCDDNIDKTIPRVVNYMGFIKTLGTDLVAQVIELVSPTTLVQIQGNVRKLNFPSVLTPDFVRTRIKSLAMNEPAGNIRYDVQVVESMSVVSKMNAHSRILRDTSMLSYFSQMFCSGSEEISSVTPFCVNLSSIKLFHILGSGKNLAATINGNLVALCEGSSENCVGFGIVRGLDTNSDKLYLISPVSTSFVQRVDTLVMGGITLPAALYTRSLKHQGAVPFVTLSTKHTTTDVPKRNYRACKFLLKN